MLHNGIKETTTSTGAVLTLTAETGFARFSGAFSVGDIVSYSLSNGDNWEWGVGAYTASNQLTRPTNPMATLDAGVYDNTTPAQLTLSGTTTVLCTAMAGAIQPPMHAVAGANYLRKFIANAYVLGGSSNSQNYFTSNPRFNIFPWRHDFSGVINSFSVYVTVPESGKTMRWGLYACDATGRPGKLIVESGDMSTASTGRVTNSITPIMLPPGWYYMAGHSNATNVAVHGTSVPTVGHAPWGMIDTSPIVAYTTATAFGASMPDPCPDPNSVLIYTTSVYVAGVTLGAA